MPAGVSLPDDLLRVAGTHRAALHPHWLIDCNWQPVRLGDGSAFLPGAVAIVPLADETDVLGLAILVWAAGSSPPKTSELLEAAGYAGAHVLRQVKAAAEIAWREEHLAIRDAMVMITSRARSLDELLRAALDELCLGLGWDAGAVWVWEAGQETLSLAAQRGFSPEAGAALRSAPAAASPFSDVLAGDSVQALAWQGAGIAAPPWACAAGIAEWLAAPLRSPDGSLGLVALCSYAPREPSRHEVALLGAVGWQVGVAAGHLRAHLRMESALRASSARWSALYESGVALTGRTDSERLLDEVVQRSVELLAGIGGLLALSEDASDDLVVVVSYRRDGTAWNLQGRRVPAGRGVLGTVAASRQPLIVENYADWPGREPDLAANALAIVAAPLLARDRLLGVLAVSDQAGRRRFTEDDVQTLTLFAQQAAAVLTGRQNRRQAEALALQSERARLACDLHDGLAQDLAALLLHADACQARLGEGHEALAGQLEAISVGLQRAIRDARATIFALRSGDVESCSLEDGLRGQAAHFESQTGVPARFSRVGADCPELAHEHELALLHLAREALTNIRKHAQAGRAQVQLTWLGAEQVQLCVSDDGRGFDPTLIAHAQGVTAQHLGLALMRERVEALGGAFSVESGVGAGTTVCAVLPVRRGETMDKIRILIVDDHALFRDGVRAVLEHQDDMTLAGEASDAECAIRLAAELRPDVILMDLQLPGRSGVEATRDIRASQPFVKVIALSMHHDAGAVDAMIQAGAQGYVLKEAWAAELMEAIRAVAGGGASFHPSVAAQVLERYREMSGANAQPHSSDVLSGRDLDLLRLLAAGEHNRDIAGKLHLSPQTVKNLLSDIYRKLDVRSRSEAVAVALRKGLIRQAPIEPL